MERHYYLSDDLDDLAAIERELEAAGVATPQIHVLSQRDADVEQRGLHEVDPFTRSDIVHSTEIGAAVGVAAAALVLVLAWLVGAADATGWMPWLFLSVVLLGFLTWQGGLFGIQVSNVRYRRFEGALQAGRHVLFVEAEPAQEEAVRRVMARHAKLDRVADEHVDTESRLVIRFRRNWKRFLDWAP